MLISNLSYRIWRWRSQYGEVLGGLGTGIGDGDRGVICGREAECCAAKERETEVDCDAQDGKDNPLASWSEVSMSSGSPPSSAATTPDQPPPPPSHIQHHQYTGNPLDHVLHADDRTPSPQLRCGYERHEIEGIGGVVKRKLVRMVKIGACVPEWEDERGMGRTAMGREARGELRSWCGWCWRVIPGRDDR